MFLNVFKNNGATPHGARSFIRTVHKRLKCRDLAPIEGPDGPWDEESDSRRRQNRVYQEFGPVEAEGFAREVVTLDDVD